MEAKMYGPLRVHVRGGVDQRGGGDGPAILLCHGFGAPGDDLVSLSRAVDAGRGVRFFFPEAPLEVQVGPSLWDRGRAWWPIDMERMMDHLMRGDVEGAMRRLDDVPDGLDAAREALVQTIEALEKEHGIRRDRLLVGGFSQGSMLATELVASLAEPFAGLVVLSGTRVAGDRWRAGLEAVGARLSALISHGRRDPLLPFGRAEALRDMMKAAGSSVSWVAHNGAHEIPQGVVDALGQFARERLAT